MAVHPVLGNKANWIYYISAWSVILSLHVILVYNYAPFSLKYAITDAFIQQGILALIGIGAWYLVRYTDLDILGRTQVLVNLGVGSITLLMLWFLISFGFLYFIFEKDYQVVGFLKDTVYLRSGVALLLFSIVVLIYYTINYYSHFHEKLKSEEKLKENAREAELAYLRSQVNPHFLFNALNSVSSFIATDSEKAQETVVELSQYLRQNMFLSKRRFVTVEDEMANISRYLDIEKIRYGDRLRKVWKIADGCKQKMLPSLILQPLFENAVKYSLHESTSLANIQAEVNCDAEYLYFVIENSYDDEARMAEGTGRGLENVNKRLSIIYERNDLMQVYDRQNVFRVEIIIPQYISDTLNRLEQ